MSYTDRNRLSDYRAVFGSEEGKRVLADLCYANYVVRSTMDRDTNVMVFREGSRAAVLQIFDYLEMTPEHLPKIRDTVRELELHMENA